MITLLTRCYSALQSKPSTCERGIHHRSAVLWSSAGTQCVWWNVLLQCNPLRYGSASARCLQAQTQGEVVVRLLIKQPYEEQPSKITRGGWNMRFSEKQKKEQWQGIHQGKPINEQAEVIKIRFEKRGSSFYKLLSAEPVMMLTQKIVHENLSPMLVWICF